MVIDMTLNKKAQLLRSYLRLDHHVVGTKLVEDIDLIKYKDLALKNGRSSYCQMVDYGTKGKVFKVRNEEFSCDTSARMVGIRDYYEDQEDIDGWYDAKFYESREIATIQKEAVRPVNKVNSGLVMGTLEGLELDPDVVIVLCNPYQAMRLIQGYTYKHGFKKQFGLSGMCGVCFESTSLPYNEQDISMSLLCAGSRANAGWSDDLMMVSFPLGMIDDIIRGIIMTANKCEPDEYKRTITMQLDSYGLSSEGHLSQGEAYFYDEE